MIKRFITLIFIIFSFTSCGYTPVYLDSNNINFNIANLELEGNNEVNNILRNKLKKYSLNDNKKRYNIKVTTDYKKVSVAKDTTGKTTNFELIVNLNLNYLRVDLEGDDREKIVTFSENIIIKRNQNNYEQNNYERTVVKNMTELLVEKIALYLSGN